MSELLAPQWLTTEVRNHIQRLIGWEIERTVKPDDARRPGIKTEPLSWEEWKQVRTGIADLWEWWGEGAHLRPQSYKVKGAPRLEQAYVNDLIEWDAPRDERINSWRYARTSTIDAHIGDGLFHLCVLVHAYMAESGQEEGQIDTANLREYQSVREIKGAPKVIFKPSGEHPDYFRNYVARINSAGWRLNPFPVGAYMPLTDFEAVNLEGKNLTEANLRLSNLSFATLYGARLFVANLEEANLTEADLISANVMHAYLMGATLKGAKLVNATLLGSYLNHANLADAILAFAELGRASIDDASFTAKNFTYGPESIYTNILEEFGKARFNFIYLNQERLDRETALQRIREIQEKARQ